MCGLSPAVVTETIFALCSRIPPWRPDEVVIITTKAGSDVLRRELFESGVFDDLKNHLSLASLQFSPNQNHIRLIPSGDGKTDSNDILTTEDNSRMADFTIGVLRQYSEDPDTEICFSIAGGKKTMSAIGGMVMSLLGRKRDMLCHVLVNQPFDNPSLKPKFYFPAKASKKHKLADGAYVHSSDAMITLCDIPFVRLRHIFENISGRLPGTYTNTVEMVNNLIESSSPPSLEIELSPRNVDCKIGGRKIELSTSEFALYLLLAERRLKKLEPLCGQTELLEEFVSFIDDIPSTKMPDLLSLKRKGGQSEDDIRRYVNRLTGKLKTRLGTTPGMDAYLPSRTKGVYGVDVPVELIKIKD